MSWSTSRLVSSYTPDSKAELESAGAGNLTSGELKAEGFSAEHAPRKLRVFVAQKAHFSSKKGGTVLRGGITMKEVGCKGVPIVPIGLQQSAFDSRFAP